MYSKVLVVLALTSLAFAKDIIEGTNNTEARKVYDSHFEASPAIWKQTKDLFINVSEHEVISKINITDLRPEKDGEAQIISGGIGHNNVTITLKSPTILRGYDFLVSVYSVFGVEPQYFSTTPDHKVQNSFDQNPQVPQEKIPAEIPSAAATRRLELHTESGLTAGTGEPTEGDTKASEVNTAATGEVTYSTAVTGEPTEGNTKPSEMTMTATGKVTTSTPKTKEFSVPEVTEDPEMTPEEAPVVVEQGHQKLQPFIEFRPPHINH